MKTLTNPTHFNFTNHFNRSLLYNRINMMDRHSSWQSIWRYGAVALVLFFTATCRQFSQHPPQENGAYTGTKYLLWNDDKLYGVVSPKATDDDLKAIQEEVTRFGYSFEINGIKRNEKGNITQIERIIMGDLGDSLTQHAQKRLEFMRMNTNEFFPLFDFYCDSEGCFENIPLKELPSSIERVIREDNLITQATLSKDFAPNGRQFTGFTINTLGDAMLSLYYEKGKQFLVKRTEGKVKYNWAGRMNDLMEASHFKRHKAMVYADSDNHLDVYDEFKKSITIFLDGKEISLDDLRQVHIRQVDVVYAHQRPTKVFITKPPFKDRDRKSIDTEYTVWIDRAPNRMKRDSSYHVISPFYTGAF
ncbi:hypothetical protein [Runella sp.]|uniref:hypothetical protein n=1 Tax=Runella sp. TaxID=1960881 RepID=UPI003D0DA0EB